MSIEVVGVPAGYATPGDYLQINFGVGPAASGSGEYAILIVGNKTSDGSATVDSVVYGPSSTPALQSEADMIALAGAGSEAHRMYRRIRKINKTTPVYAIFPTESAGANATGTLALAGGASANCTFRVWCGDDFADTPVATGNTNAVVGAAAVIQCNNKTEWPVTFAGTTTLTATAKQKGPRGNEIRIRAAFINADGTIGLSVTPNNTSTALTSGATSDTWTTALATLLPGRYYYIVSPSNDVAGATFDDLVTQVLTQALPATGIRQRVITGHVGTQANASTVAATSTINTPRAQVWWHENSEWTAGEIAAEKAAQLAMLEDMDPAYNTRDFGKGTVGSLDTSSLSYLPAQYDQSKWATATSVETALKNGVSPIASRQDGGTHIVWSITSKHKNGSNFDYRSRSTHIVSVLDRFADELIAAYAAELGAKKIIDDPQPGEQILAPNVASPRTIKALVYRLVDEYGRRGLFKNVDTIKNEIEVVRDENNLSAVGVRIPARVIDLLLQTKTVVDDVSTAQ